MSKDKIQISSLKPYMDVEGLNVDSEVLRKRFSSKISISPDEDKTCVALISTIDEDADGDVIIPTGADLKRFTKNPVIMYAHNYSGKPIAKAVALSVNEDGIHCKMKFADTEEANDVWSLIKGGFLNANSIGFIILEGCRRGTEEWNAFLKENKMKVADTVQRIITKFELLESSIVPIPCNSEALMVAVSNKSITLSPKTLKELDLPKVVVIEKEISMEQDNKDAGVEPSIPVVSVAPVVAPVVKQPCPCEECEKEECACKGKECEDKACVCGCHKPEERFIKVIRFGYADIKKLAEMRALAKKGKII